MKKLNLCKTVLFALMLIAVVFTGCNKKSSGPVTIRYTLWDSAQLPAYQKCADVFMEKNPNIKIEISQFGWNDYWTGLQTDMVAGSAPDVFTDHLSYYMDFATKGQLVDLQQFVKRDNIDTSIYMNDLEKLWETQDGKRYGLPKDWDTICIVYNTNMTNVAGFTHDEINNLNWNPYDGGSFETFIAKCSIDSKGRNGLDPNFDASNVVQYGLALSHSDDRGQAQYSGLAQSTGWTYTDGLYDHNYHYDDPRFIATIEWMHKMQEKGFSAPYPDTASEASNVFAAGKCASVFDGSWMIGVYTNIADFPVEFAKLPAGEKGVKSMINGLGDSIWSGSKHQEEAWQWVKFLASKEAQDIVGSFGVVFPAIESGVQNALKVYESKGLDVSPFAEESTTPNCTFLYPIVDNSTKIAEIMRRTFDKIFLNVEPADSALKSANAEVNGLFN